MDGINITVTLTERRAESCQMGFESWLESNIDRETMELLDETPREIVMATLSVFERLEAIEPRLDYEKHPYRRHTLSLTPLEAKQVADELICRSDIDWGDGYVDHLLDNGTDISRAESASTRLMNQQEEFAQEILDQLKGLES